MMSWATLGLPPTFLFVSLTPGMCMTLAMVLGMTQGVKRTLWMMIGELIGVGFVAAAAGAGVAALMLRQPELFIAFKWWAVPIWPIWASYVALTGPCGYSSELDTGPALGVFQFATQGLVTAVANPKGGRFYGATAAVFDGSLSRAAAQYANCCHSHH